MSISNLKLSTYMVSYEKIVKMISKRMKIIDIKWSARADLRLWMMFAALASKRNEGRASNPLCVASLFQDERRLDVQRCIVAFGDKDPEHNNRASR